MTDLHLLSVLRVLYRLKVGGTHYVYGPYTCKSGVFELCGMEHLK